MANIDNPWLKTDAGWVAFVSDLGQEKAGPDGEPIRVSDGTWKANRDSEGDILDWTKTTPEGKALRIYND